jgi:hypothetical protein
MFVFLLRPKFNFSPLEVWCFALKCVEFPLHVLTFIYRLVENLEGLSGLVAYYSNSLQNSTDMSLVVNE